MDNQTMRLLTDEEIQELDTRQDLIKIKIDFGNLLDTSKEYTAAEFADFFNDIAVQYRKTALESIFTILQQNYKQLSSREPSKKVRMPEEYKFSKCGGCGCTPAGPCYVAHIGCFWCGTSS